MAQVSGTVNQLQYHVVLLCTLTLLSTGLSAQARLHDSLLPHYDNPALLEKAHSVKEEPWVYVRNYRLWAEQSENYSRAEALWKKALKLSVEQADSFDYLPLIGIKARAQMGLGKYSLAAQTYLKGMRAMAHLDCGPQQKGWFKMGFGILLFKVKLYSDAQEYFELSLEHLQEANSKVGAAVALNNIGLCLEAQEKPKKALGKFQQAFEIRKKLGNSFFMAHSTIYLAQSRLALGEYQKADSLIQSLEEFAIRSNRREFKKEVYTLWAELNLKRGEAREALEKLYLAENDHTGIFDDFHNLEIFQLYGRAHRALGNRDSALFYFDKGLKSSVELYDRWKQLEFLQELGAIYREQGDYRKENDILQQETELYHVINQDLSSILAHLVKTEQEVMSSMENYDALANLNDEQDKLIAYQKGLLTLSIMIMVVILFGSASLLKLNKRLRKAKNHIKAVGQRTLLVGNKLDIGILSLDAEGKIDYFNRAAELHFLEHYELSLKPGHDFISKVSHPDHKEVWEYRIEQSQERSQWQEMQSYDNNDQTRYYQHHFVTVTNKGEYQGLVALINDLTENVVQNRLMSKKTKALEQALETKDRMISLLAHDLKEGVISSLELARYTSDLEEIKASEEGRENIGMIETALSKTKTLLLKTLDWVQNAENEPQKSNRSFYLSKLSRDVITGLSERLESKGIALDLQIDPQLKVQSDPEMVGTVIRNLISNAIKFSHSADGKIEVYAKELKQEVEMHVKDHGTGLDKEVLERIVKGQKNHSLNGTDGEEGTGLGLKLCQELLTMHNSFLQVQSKKGSGADFYFKIPKSKQH